MIFSTPNPRFYIHDKWIEVVDSLKLCQKCQYTILFTPHPCMKENLL